MSPDPGKIFGRGVAFPPQVGEDGRWAFSEGAENVRQSMRVILLTEPRERVMLPAFGGGLRRFLFEPNTAATRRLIEEAISQSLARWEPRVELESVSVDQDPADPRAAVATVRYKLIATQASDQLQLRVRFIS